MSENRSKPEFAIEAKGVKKRRRLRSCARKHESWRFFGLSRWIASAGLSLGLASVSGGQQTALTPNDELVFFDNFGVAVAIDGNTAVVGKDGDNTQGLSAGAAFIFELDAGGNQWVQTAKLFGDTGG